MLSKTRLHDWRVFAFGVSVLGNILFGFALIVWYYNSPEEGGVAVTGRLIAANCVARAQEPLHFCEPQASSELGRVFPNNVFVASDGLMRAQFAFTDERLSVLESVTVSDQHGRPWATLYLEDGTFIYNRYAGLSDPNPFEGLKDRDGDGIPDVLIKWEAKESFERVAPIEWRRLERK